MLGITINCLVFEVRLVSQLQDLAESMIEKAFGMPSSWSFGAVVR